MDGGYAGLRRRLFRLGHIAFVGLGLINFMFYFTVSTISAPSQLIGIASLMFVLGAITMPVFCFLLGIFPKLKYFFYIPVISLLVGGLLTTWEVVLK